MVLAAVVASRWFHTRRGLVVGFLSAANATGQLIFLPVMARQRHGRIVNIGADSLRTGIPGHAAYNAAKGGVLGLTVGLARDWAHTYCTFGFHEYDREQLVEAAKLQLKAGHKRLKMVVGVDKGGWKEDAKRVRLVREHFLRPGAQPLVAALQPFEHLDAASQPAAAGPQVGRPLAGVLAELVQPFALLA